MKAAHEMDWLSGQLVRIGVKMSVREVAELSLIERKLQRWNEEECNGTIQRDETTGKPFRYFNVRGQGTITSEPIFDKERQLIERVKVICKQHGLNFYLQGDPRGAALYVSREPLTQANYSTVGIACVVD